METKNRRGAAKSARASGTDRGLPDRQKVILETLLREYELALLLDLRSDSYEIFKLSPRFAGILAGRLKDRFSATVLDIADHCVYSYDYDLFIGAISPDSIKNRLESDEFIGIVFRAITSRGPEYFRMRLIRAQENGKAFVGVSCIQDERSRELQQRKLFEGALDRARSADSAKSTFLTSMSYDIRTPMNAIIGFTNIASANLDDTERVKDALDKIRTSSDHLLSLINNVLDMSRIESGRVTISEDRCDFRTLSENVQKILQAQISSKDLTFVINTSRVITPEVYCDETRITQLLINLLSNAVKYTEPGGEVSLEILQRPGGVNRRYCKYEFIVSDNGIGMSKSFLARVFEPFERESGRIGNESYGSGLGMSIAKGIVDLMGGSIRVESEENKGTQFFVELEFRPFKETDDAQYDTVPEEDGTGNGDIGGEDLAVFHNAKYNYTDKMKDTGWIEGRRLLLVEDNPLNREIALEMLAEDGFNVEVAENGRLALRKIMVSDPWYFSAILMDIQMPIMDGYEATERIRALPDRSKACIPIIAMTANAFKEDRIKAEECGMDAYITKPVDVLALRYVLRRVLR